MVNESYRKFKITRSFPIRQPRNLHLLINPGRTVLPRPLYTAQNLSMKTVVLDGYTLNPGDLSWEGLEKIGGELILHDRTPADEVVAHASGADVLFTNKTPLPADVIGQLPDLKYIGVLATGFNVVDIDAAAKRGIPVTNIPTYGTDSVAQMVFAHVLNFSRHVQYHADTVRENRWAECDDFCYWDFPQIELNGLTLGLIGLGRIGTATALIGLAFGMKVVAFDPYAPDSIPEGIELAELDTVLASADFLSLHCPLTSENHHLMNAARFACMKDSAFLINTSRGPLVDEGALLEALQSKQIAGAGLDVLEQEPARKDHPLYAQPNCWITPHISWATRSARARLMQTAVDNLQVFLNGGLQNCVNGVQR